MFTGDGEGSEAALSVGGGVSGRPAALVEWGADRGPAGGSSGAGGEMGSPSSRHRGPDWDRDRVGRERNNSGSDAVASRASETECSGTGDASCGGPSHGRGAAVRR